MLNMLLTSPAVYLIIYYISIIYVINTYSYNLSIRERTVNNNENFS
jgi:hypothetical protein